MNIKFKCNSKEEVKNLMDLVNKSMRHDQEFFDGEIGIVQNSDTECTMFFANSDGNDTIEAYVPFAESESSEHDVIKSIDVIKTSVRNVYGVMIDYNDERLVQPYPVFTPYYADITLDEFEDIINTKDYRKLFEEVLDSKAAYPKIEKKILEWIDKKDESITDSEAHVYLAMLANIDSLQRTISPMLSTLNPSSRIEIKSHVSEASRGMGMKQMIERANTFTIKIKAINDVIHAFRINSLSLLTLLIDEASKDRSK